MLIAQKDESPEGVLELLAFVGGAWRPRESPVPFVVAASRLGLVEEKTWWMDQRVAFKRGNTVDVQVVTRV